MGKMGKFDASGLRKLQKELERVKEETEGFQEHCAKKLAHGLLSKVKERTPVGQYGSAVEFDANIPEKQVEFNTKEGKHVSFRAKARKKHVKFSVKTGKVGGTLRRNWTVSSISHVDGKTVIEVLNPTEYASWWESGHRTANHKGWVQGRFVLKTASAEVEAAAPKVIQKETDKWLGGALK